MFNLFQSDNVLHTTHWWQLAAICGQRSCDRKFYILSSRSIYCVVCLHSIENAHNFQWQSEDNHQRRWQIQNPILSPWRHMPEPMVGDGIQVEEVTLSCFQNLFRKWYRSLRKVSWNHYKIAWNVLRKTSCFSEFVYKIVVFNKIGKTGDWKSLQSSSLHENFW